MSYQEFLASKRITAEPCGFQVEESRLQPALFDFQRRIVSWACARGRAAVFADCGLGKTPMQLEWARLVAEHTGQPVLILAPLAVSQQTRREGEKFAIKVQVCAEDSEIRQGVNVTNYEKLHRFTPARLGGIVLDESSILKAFDGKTRKAITAFSQPLHYRLACTATPAPNDLIELTNHAEYLSTMTGKEIIALFFRQDGNTTHKWRLKGHAQADFWRWLASWAVAIRQPSDLGYDDGRFVLPELHLHHVEVPVPASPGHLFTVEAASLADVRRTQRDTLPQRVARAAELCNDLREPWLVWCNLNAESEALARSIDGAVEVRGSMSAEEKERALLGFLDGSVRVLVTKPLIAGFGMNFQHCAHTAFVGLSYSYEQYYQAIRRCWRFGQTREVHCHLIAATTEGAVLQAIEDKERQSARMFEEIVHHMSGLQLDGATRDEMPYEEAVATGEGWEIRLGDSVEQLRHVADESVGLSVFSPPFPGMYAYTNSPRDVGNTGTIEEMMDHFSYLVPELLRVTMPGRLCCVHLMQLTSMKSREGYIGVKDYRGATIELYQRHGWVYAGEVTIDKNPQVQAVRNKERGLLFKSLANDSSVMRMALADYLIYFRKPGDNPEPIRAGVSKAYANPNGWITEAEWVEWASPVWYRARKGVPGGIRETDVLNVEQARDSEDERHLCPLQLGVIERAVKLWSNPGDLVLDPYAGIGSTGYMALRLGRRFVWVELKRSYWQHAQRNLDRAPIHTPTLFDGATDAPRDDRSDP